LFSKLEKKAKLNFQHHYSSLQSHDPSENILICRFASHEIFLLINVETSCAASYFPGFFMKRMFTSSDFSKDAAF